MVWTLETSRGLESDKIAALVVPYTRGKGLDIGCGMRKVWPGAIGIDNKHHFGQSTAADIEGDGKDLRIFSDSSLDYVFSSHTLEHFKPEDVPAVMTEWARVLKPGSYLVLYLPSSNLYPKVGEPGANPDHKWDIYPGSVAKILCEATECGWTQLEDEERGHDPKSEEYSLFEIYQKREDGQFIRNLWQRNPEGKKRLFLIRYGAIGDQIIVSSILPELKKQGYHVTYNTTPDAMKILKCDPNIDEWWLQDTDQVPNYQLGSYWKSLELSGRYDKIINLCESIEGQLLTLPGRLTNEYSHEARHKLLNKNYLEITHDIADVPHNFNPRFYPDEQEKLIASDDRAGIDMPIIVWGLNGSSPHKVYPWTHIVSAWLLQQTPVHIYFITDAKEGKLLQDGVVKELEAAGVDMTRVHPMGGTWDIRQSLSFAVTQANCVVGPETGLLNAVSFEDMPKVLYLSHSSEENLTKHWKNTKSLAPESSACPCYPCHRLHTNWDNCVQVEQTRAALCASSITPEILFQSIAIALGAQKIREAA